jgi:hypothetical protein
MLFDDMNWMAVIVGATLAFGLGMIWFSPVMFGRAWAAGNHGINPPASLPVTAMLIQGLGTFALALVVGLPDTGGLISTAVLAILAASLLVAGMAFSAKIPGRDADRRGLHCSDGRNHDLGSNPLAENNHLGVALTEAR